MTRMLHPETTRTGGRRGVRRFVVLPAVFALLAMPLDAADRAEAQPSVSVNEDRGVYLVSARFDVPQPVAQAVAVLQDYEGIPRFMPEVKTSVVRERGERRVVVEQEAVSRMMMFSRRIHLLLDIHESDGALRFRDTSGRSFKRYEGAWRLAGRGGRTEITYELLAQPSFEVPEFILKRLLRRNAGQMIEQLRREIAARASAPAS